MVCLLRAAPGVAEKVAVGGAVSAAAITSLCIPRKRLSGRALFGWCLGGLLMELPQRLMMQSALFALMQLGGVPDAARWAVLCCAAGLVLRDRDAGDADKADA